MHKKIVLFLSSAVFMAFLFSCNQNCPPCPDAQAAADSSAVKLADDDKGKQEEVVSLLLTRKSLYCNKEKFGEDARGQVVTGKDQYSRVGYHWTGYGVPSNYFGQKCDPAGGDNATLVYGAAVWQEVSDGGGLDSVFIVLPANK